MIRNVFTLDAGSLQRNLRIVKNGEYSYIELFAGCGGMSLGLEAAGFQRILANEISPMAAETFAYNLVKGARGSEPPRPAFPESWDPHFTFLDPPTGVNGGILAEGRFRDWRLHSSRGWKPSEKAKAAALGRGSSDLLVGHAGKLATLLEHLKSEHPRKFHKRFGDVALLAGGPPCQSFSLAGRRQRDHPRNRLFESFVAITKLIRPKVVMFENVLGITRPFRDEAGHEWHPWHEVCRAFRLAGYLPIPALVNAANFGVPQSRPRFIMIAISEEVAKKAEKRGLVLGGVEIAFKRAREGYEESSKDRDLIFRADEDFDARSWPTPLFPMPSTSHLTDQVSVLTAIGDLLSIDHNGTFKQGDFAKGLDMKLTRPQEVPAPARPENHKARKHGPHAVARFRLLRTLAQKGIWAKSMLDVASREEEAVDVLVGSKLLVPEPDGHYAERLATRSDVRDLIRRLASGKNVQKCLNPNKPAGAQLSIPDDSIHWGVDRVLTIREMARIQSFPDWFEFRSKETTGSCMRAYEVPQYTQVGNAVPPLLALAFGDAIRNFLLKLKQFD